MEVNFGKRKIFLALQHLYHEMMYPLGGTLKDYVM